MQHKIDYAILKTVLQHDDALVNPDAAFRIDHVRGHVRREVERGQSPLVHIDDTHLPGSASAASERKRKPPNSNATCARSHA